MGAPGSRSQFFGALPIEGAVENLVAHQILKQREPALRRAGSGGDEGRVGRCFLTLHEEMLWDSVSDVLFRRGLMFVKNMSDV
jgi:hypothetical protein